MFKRATVEQAYHNKYAFEVVVFKHLPAHIEYRSSHQTSLNLGILICKIKVLDSIFQPGLQGTLGDSQYILAAEFLKTF